VDMGIKSIVFLGLLTLCFTTFSQGIEEQRKYQSEDISSLRSFLLSSDSLDGFKSFHHSEYIFYDLYLDTPNRELYEIGYSLRLRKKIYDEINTAYAFQLKSEMQNSQGFRTEIEEPELDFYMLKHQSEDYSLSQLLDEIFDLLEDNKLNELGPYFESLNNWITYKANGAIAPFQKMRNWKNPPFSIEKIQLLQPAIIGKSKRIRNHFYVYLKDANDILGFDLDLVRAGNLPTFFIDHPERYWLVESSLDSSIFYSLLDSSYRPISIEEFEMESKYISDEIGIQILDQLEAKLKSKFGLKVQLDSKYKQSIKFLKE
jgi:hypothetical protein